MAQGLQLQYSLRAAADFIRRAPQPQAGIRTAAADKLGDVEIGYKASARVVRIAGTSFFVPDELESIPLVLSAPSEVAVLAVFKTVLHHGSRCDSRNRRRSTVLDIGANEGFFGLLAAAWGCLTYFFEPQPSCQAALRASLLLNHFDADVARVVPLAVSSEPREIVVSSTAPCVGQFPRHPRSYDARAKPLHLQKRSDRKRVTSINVTDVIDSPVLLAKVDGMCTEARLQLTRASHCNRVCLCADPGLRHLILCVRLRTVEGGELSVIESMLPLLRRGLVRNVVVEITPGWWPGGEFKYGCVQSRGCASAIRAMHIAREIDSAGYIVERIPGRGWPAACDPATRPRRPYARPAYSTEAAKTPCRFSHFLQQTMNETLHEIYQQDVWLRHVGQDTSRIDHRQL